MMRTRLLYQRLAALFVAGWLFFDFPLLALWTSGGSGVALPVALFIGWAVLVGVLAWWMERDGAAEGDEVSPAPGASKVDPG